MTETCPNCDEPAVGVSQSDPSTARVTPCGCLVPAGGIHP